jgi:tetratricopeptide (TPR) repeat protein
LRLIEEIKDRAKRSIGVKNYPEAIQLYSKAIELQPDDAILFSNRSMCYCQMNKGGEALEDSEKSILRDPNYAKAYYRKGSALLVLKNLIGAKAAFEDGLKLAPGDQSFISQLDKIRVLPAVTETPIPVSTKSSASFPKLSSPFAPAPASAAPVSDSNDSQSTPGEDIPESSAFRGYKKTADGRVTTFFNNELDDETKALIGDIAPKKIDPNQSSLGSSTPTGGESVWNKAGTWEERVHTPWALQRLRELIEAISIPVSEGGGGAISLKGLSLSGDAQVRGDT